MPNNDLGNPKNITNKTFEEAAKASGKSVKEAKTNAGTAPKSSRRAGGE
jgi:hypothetical protein